MQKKSREESQGAESGVEILVNEPYTEGPGAPGQYTHKMYHVGRHLPGWLKAILPKSALIVDEEAWNAYPYTKTRYTCPFVEKFFIEIETRYFDDDGRQENVFDMTEEDLKERTVDLIDIVKDQLYGTDFEESEDPTTYKSDKTGRGPLTEGWIESNFESKTIMCAYKVCRVEFRYWGMQTKIERFIHDYALRRVMLRAHRQAWAWQDEWVGLNMEDIRKMEKEVQEVLAQKMKRPIEENDLIPSLDTDQSIKQQSSSSSTSATVSSVPPIKSSSQRSQSIKSEEVSDDEFVDAI